MTTIKSLAGYILLFKSCNLILRSGWLSTKSTLARTKAAENAYRHQLPYPNHSSLVTGALAYIVTL